MPIDSIIRGRLLRGLWVAIVAAAAYVAIRFVTPLVYPFLIAWVIAYMLNPFINVLQRGAKLPRWLSVTIAILLFVGIAAGIITIIVTNVILEIGSFSESIQRHILDWTDRLVEFINSDPIQSIIGQLNSFYAENPQYQNTINNNLSSTAKTIANFGSGLVGSLLNGVVGFLTSLPSRATIMLVVLLATFFIAKDWYKIQTRFSPMFPYRVRTATRDIWSDLQKALFGYLRAQLILISLTGLVVTLGLIVLRVDYAITIGFFIGLADLMPYLGPGAVMVPWIIITFMQGDVYLGIGLSVLYGVILIARQLLEPKVLATSVGLEPLPLLIAMFVGLQLFGVLGLIIGPVSLIIIAAFRRAGVFRDIARYVMDGRNKD